jgi:hypothetical protein
MKFKIILFLYIIFSFLTSCDNFYSYNFIITNESTDNIEVSFVDNDIVENHNIIISSNETKTIFYFEFGGKCQKAYGKNNCPPSQIDSIEECFYELQIKKNDTITKTDFTEVDKWTFSAVDGLGTYTTTVTDSDF